MPGPISPAHPAGSGRAWRPAPVLEVLRAEIDLAWPHRSTASDGFLGDQLHQARKSQHNPDQDGYVCAIDITADVHNGPPPALLAEFFRRVGDSQSQRLNPGGYVIYSRRIASAAALWRWRPYGGQDPHVGHIHLSCSYLPEFYKISRAWNVARGLRELAAKPLWLT